MPSETNVAPKAKVGRMGLGWKLGKTSVLLNIESEQISVNKNLLKVKFTIKESDNLGRPRLKRKPPHLDNSI